MHPSRNTRLHEYQFVAMCAFSPELTDQYPDARRYLYLPESKSLFDAVKKLKSDDPLLLAGLMSRNGFPQATPKFVMTKMLIVGQTWPASDINVTVSELPGRGTPRDWTALKDIEFELAAARSCPAGSPAGERGLMERIDPNTDRVLDSATRLPAKRQGSRAGALVSPAWCPGSPKRCPPFGRRCGWSWTP